jgi:hypothetical protein
MNMPESTVPDGFPFSPVTYSGIPSSRLWTSRLLACMASNRRTGAFTPWKWLRGYGGYRERDSGWPLLREPRYEQHTCQFMSPMQAVLLVYRPHQTSCYNVSF